MLQYFLEFLSHNSNVEDAEKDFLSLGMKHFNFGIIDNTGLNFSSTNNENKSIFRYLNLDAIFYSNIVFCGKSCAGRVTRMRLERG